MTSSNNEKIKDTQLSDALSERYLAYAMSTIVSRSLPDVRDGLKPVHRRLLYAMRQLKLDPKSGYKKCARVVGDVIGKYHPHGDSAVYMAMVRLAQSFSVRYPLVDGQGNFGNIDGDSPAAMRYTEARMTDIAIAMMEGINEDAIDFRETYDGEDKEPIVMPAAFPNLLANGSSGIAVGMATNIPPHNVGEVCDSLLYLIDNPMCEIKPLVKKLKGPDFPTGGIITEDFDSILETYTKGKGAFRLRAKWEKEELERGQYQIVITEIPYQVQKSKLIEKIANLLFEKKIPLLNDIIDESTEDVRIVLEPKSRTVDANFLMEHLYKQTDLEIKFNLNMNVLDKNNVPRVMNIKEVLEAFLEHRIEVLIRRSQYRLNKINYRLEILDGYLIAFLNLDEVIRIIRFEDDAKQKLIETFNLTDNQAEAILNMKLRSLRKLEEVEIKKEHAELSAEKAEIEALLACSEKQKEVISDQIKDIRTKFGKRTVIGKRRTEFTGAVEEIDVPLEAMIEKEPITILLSEKGWVRSVKGHASEDEEFKFKDGDELKFMLKSYTTEKIIIFDNSGKFYTICAHDIPGGRGYGQPVRLMIDLHNGDEITSIFNYVQNQRYLIASNSGRGFMVDDDHIFAQTRNGKKIMNLAEGEKAIFCIPETGDSVAIVGENRKLLVFPANEIPNMARGRGVILQKYKDGTISDIKYFNMEEGLAYPCGNGTKVEKELLAWIGHRAYAGKFVPFGFPKNNKFTR
jgi:topoisomerase-4 subunit A